MTSLSDPPCSIEHELYVENAVWILHTLSTREFSYNERLRPGGVGGGGGGMGTLIFSYTRRLGPFFGAQKFELQYVFVLFLGGGYEEFFLGVLEILETQFFFFLGGEGGDER